MHELEQTLNAVRQVHLASLPTPLARLSRLEQQWGHSGLYIKRDDMTGLGPGGNKLRSLEFLLGEAVEEKADVILASGPLQSNLCTLAAAACASVWAGRLIALPVRVIRATPVASFILLILLWTDRSVVPGVIAGLMVLPVVWGNLCRGIRETDPKLLELAAAYRFSWWKRVRLIYLPSLRPYFLAAVTTAMGLAWKSGVAAEVLCIPRPAIGTQIYNSKLYLDIPDLFAWTVAVVALSLLLEGLLRALLERDKRRENGA